MRLHLWPVVFIFIPLADATRINLELAERYRRYAECLRRREEATKEDKALHLQPVEVVRGSDVVLACFTCVAPEDAVEIESTYKPSAGSVGRAAKKVVDFFRRKLLGAAAFPKYKWAYDWEYAPPGQGWQSLTNIHAKKDFVERISAKVRRFLNRDDSKWTLGDQYELRLHTVDRNNSGFYRCINKNVKGEKSKEARMGNFYFLDVKTKISRIMVESEEAGIPKRAKELIPMTGNKTPGLKMEPVASQWSTCSQCGDRLGEQTRKIECRILSTKPYLTQLEQESAWLKLLGSVPCTSSLVPLDLRRKHNYPMVMQYKSCYARCYSNATTDRFINSTDDLGETRIMDYLPKGEFLFGEILPKLLPPVIRRGYLVTEGDPLVLTCDFDPAEGIGIHWHSKTELELTINRIIAKFEGRVWIDEQMRLIFDKVELTDKDMYYCYSSERILLGVHNVIVMENDNTKQLVSTFEMVFKFTILAFIMVFIITKVFS